MRAAALHWAPRAAPPGAPLLRPALRRSRPAVPAPARAEAAAAAAGAMQRHADAPRPARAFLIFNPIAGQGAPDAELGAVALRLSAALPGGLTVLQTRPDVHAEALARRALDEGADLVVVRWGRGAGRLGGKAGLSAGRPGPASAAQWPRGAAAAARSWLHALAALSPPRPPPVPAPIATAAATAQ
jgi:hypothetical protein